MLEIFNLVVCGIQKVNNPERSYSLLHCKSVKPVSGVTGDFFCFLFDDINTKLVVGDPVYAVKSGKYFEMINADQF